MVGSFFAFFTFLLLFLCCLAARHCLLCCLPFLLFFCLLSTQLDFFNVDPQGVGFGYQILLFSQHFAILSDPFVGLVFFVLFPVRQFILSEIVS